MRHLSRVAMLCGLVVALTAATVGTAFFGARSWLTWLPLAVGLAAVVLGGLASLREGANAATARARARLVAECTLAVVLAVVANVASFQVPLVVDVTASKRNTLSEASEQVAKAIATPVAITATLEGDDRAFVELTELVGRYQRVNPAITLTRLAPEDDPGSAVLEAKVVVSSGDRRRRVRFGAGAPDQEELLTKAIRAVTVESRARAWVLAGHGEPALADEAPAGLRRFGQALADEGLDVVPLPLGALLSAGGKMPDDAGVVIVAAPVAVPPDHAAVLQKYLDDGGRLLVLLEPHADSGLASLLGSVGVAADDDVIIDSSAFSGLLGGPETATGTAYASHPVTQKLGGAMTHFPRARSLSILPGTPAEPQALVQTGAEAFGEMTRGPASLDDADVRGPVTLAVAAALPAEGTKPAGRIVVIGDATAATNQAIGLGANQDLLLNASLWLLARDEAIVVRPRGRGGNLLLLSPTARERIAFVLLYGLPVALLCAGLAVSAIRRRR